MDHGTQGRPELMGRSPEQWEDALTQALEMRDYIAMRRLIADLGREVLEEGEGVCNMQDLPALSQVVEWARRLVNTDPTHLEALEEELKEESCLWKEFRQRYTDTFVPGVLEPYLRKTAALVSPDNGGIQFRGFEKYSGVYEGTCSEAVTLFFSPEDTSGRTPNFFSRYERQTATFVISRAYRMGLPPGSGAACIEEHIHRLCAEPNRTRRIYIDDIKNAATYEACVEKCEESEPWRVRVGADPIGTPLGKLACRLAARSGLTVSSAQISLDGYGFLDLIFTTEPLAP